MPKKKSTKRKKKAVEDIPVHLQEDLPQVWLAVQPGQESDELQAVGSQAEIIEAKPAKKVVIRDERLSLDSPDIIEPQEVTATDIPGWDEQEELDYSKLAQQPNTPLLPVLPVIRRASETVEVENWQRRPSGISSQGSMFSYAHPTSHHVKFMGEITAVSNDWIDETAPQSLLKIVEMAQRHGDIPYTSKDTSNDSTRIISISKYGIKVTDGKKQRVFGRIPLHNIVNAVHYTSIHSTAMVLLRVYNDETKSNLFLYECQSNEDAGNICVTLGQAFDTVLNKMKMEENLHGPLIQ